MRTNLVEAAEHIASSSRVRGCFPHAPVVALTLKYVDVGCLEYFLTQQFSGLDQTTNAGTDNNAELVMFCH
jgi:hypothetical protein